MVSYLVCTILIDIFMTIKFLNKGKNKLAAFAPISLYFINALIWMFILGNTNPGFSGQGAIGLVIILGFGIACSILRSLLGIGLFYL